MFAVVACSAGELMGVVPGGREGPRDARQGGEANASDKPRTVRISFAPNNALRSCGRRSIHTRCRGLMLCTDPDGQLSVTLHQGSAKVPRDHVLRDGPRKQGNREQKHAQGKFHRMKTAYAMAAPVRLTTARSVTMRADEPRLNAYHPSNAGKSKRALPCQTTACRAQCCTPLDTLAITRCGSPLCFYSDTEWSRGLVSLLRGPQSSKSGRVKVTMFTSLAVVRLEEGKFIILCFL